jgi:hypothetical protein
MIRMFDDVTVRLIPADAQAVAGYVNGRWANYPDVVKRFPKALHLSISVNRFGDADCLDVEKGDATNDEAPAWVRRQQKRGVRQPVVYTSTSNAAALLRVLARAGITRSQIRLWTAHYTYHPHICDGKCGFGNFQADGTQWTDKSMGRSLDESLLKDSFFGAKLNPVPVKSWPKPPSPMPGWWWDWADWRRSGRVGPRPDTPYRIPLWAWGALVKYNRKHPQAN